MQQEIGRSYLINRVKDYLGENDVREAQLEVVLSIIKNVLAEMKEQVEAGEEIWQLQLKKKLEIVDKIRFRSSVCRD